MKNHSFIAQIKAFAILMFILIAVNQEVFAGVSKINDVDFQFSKDQLKQLDSPFMFLRTFVPYYYKVISENKNQLSVLSVSEQFRSQCAGDAHLENFGAFFPIYSSVVFSVNDLDDTENCPAIHDFLRLAITSRVAGLDFTLKKILAAYRAGLTGQQIEMPDYIQQLVSKANKNGTIPDQGMVENSQVRILRDDQSIELSAKEQVALKEKFGVDDNRIRMLDAIRTSKTIGGSTGMKRYLVLLENSQQQRSLWELKELGNSSLNALEDHPKIDPALRIQRALNIFYGDSSALLYRTTKFLDGDYLMRPRFEGQKKIKVEKLKANDQEKVISFVANTIGLLHRLGSNQSAAQLSASLKTIDADKLDIEVSNFAQFFIQKYSQL